MTPERRPGAVAAAAAVGGVLGLGVALVATPLLVAAGLAVVGTLLLAADRRLLWVSALVLFAALPLAYLPVPAGVLTVSPPVLLMLALGLRTVLDRAEGRVVLSWSVLLTVAFGAWLVVAVVASDDRLVSMGWFVSYGCLVVLPALLAAADSRVRDALRRTWVVLGALLGTYAMLETFVLQANPLLDPIYSSGMRDPLVQQWSVYRATTTLGHPVNNGAFFAIAVPLALGAAMSHRSWLAAVAAAAAAGGVVASGSRAAFGAMLLGAAVVVLLPPSRQGTRSRAGTAGRAAGALAIVVALIAGTAYLATRGASGEGASSARFRLTQIPIALDKVREAPVLGTGPGTASLSEQSLLARIGGAGAFESYWLELVVGAGVPGLLLGGAVVLAAAVVALRTGAPDVVGALVAWTVTATFLNALEGGRPNQLVLGVVLAMAFAGSACARRPGYVLPEAQAVHPVDTSSADSGRHQPGHSVHGTRPRSDVP